MRPRRSLLAALVLLGLGSLPGQERGDGTADPRDIGLEERTGQRLSQFDVTVRGPRELIGSLTREDFELIVASRPVDEFTVDNLCRLPDETAEEESTSLEAPGATAQPESAPRENGSYLFYFDQSHLKMEGRWNAIEITESLIPTLIVNGNRGMIVSNADKLVTYADLTDDPDKLLEGLERLRRDKKHWDPAAQQEETRMEQLILTMRGAGVSAAMDDVRQFAREEVWRGARALSRFSTVLARLADLDPPKATIYFADTMRSNAGEHWLDLFSASVIGKRDERLRRVSQDALSAMYPYQKLLDEANAHGVRLYTVQAEGLTSETLQSRATIDAKNSLSGLALETGGKAFLNGVRASKIGATIRDDLSCTYLISFDPTGFLQDEGLRLGVRMKRPGVKVDARGRIVIQSEGSRRTSLLLAAFSAPRANESSGELQGILLPTGFSEGRYRALVQLSMPGSLLPGSRWDLGASLVSSGRVREEATGHLEIDGPNVPVVFEQEMSFRPGPFEVIMVAHETNADEIYSRQVDAEWPDPDQAPITLPPFRIAQPQRGAFLRDGEVRLEGSLGLDDGEPVDVDRPAALVGLVCRGKKFKRGLRVERRLTGASSLDLDPMKLELREDRCVQLRDVIPAGTLGVGSFSYQVRVLDGDEQLAEAQLAFNAVERGDG